MPARFVCRGVQGASRKIVETLSILAPDSASNAVHKPYQILARINRVLAGDFSSSSQNVGMCPARPGFEYDFEKELKAEFAPDQLLGPAKCFQVMNGLFCADQKRLSKKHLSAAIQAGRAKRRPHRMLSTAPLHASHTTRPLSPTDGRH
jgi:hypothetical protein